MDTIYRLLQPDEWDRLKDLFDDSTRIPSPSFSKVAVAEVDGSIVAFGVLQVAFHLEPIKIVEQYRGKISLRKMASLLESSAPEVKNYYSFAPNDRIGNLAERVNGMKKLDWMVYHKVLGDE